jgi:hypothetical protein
MLAIPFDKLFVISRLVNKLSNKPVSLIMYDILRPEITWFFPLHLGSSEELLREFGGATKGVRRHYFGSSEALLREFGGTISVSRRNYLRRASDLRQEGDLLREVLDRSFTLPTVVLGCPGKTYCLSVCRCFC